jgi:hypothetical protein
MPPGAFSRFSRLEKTRNQLVKRKRVMQASRPFANRV